MTAVEAILNADDLEAFKQKGVTANRWLLESEQGHEMLRLEKTKNHPHPCKVLIITKETYRKPQ